MVSSATEEHPEIVVLVHGLYMHGLAMLPLDHWMRACGFQTRRFSYPALTRSVPDNATRLARYLQAIDAPTVHFLCHSLGGTVVRAMLLQYDWQRPGRVLTLGTPHLGSYVARRLGANRALAWAVGKSLQHGLDGDLAPWPRDREVATIAGNRSIGAGRVVPGLPKPNDGVVALAETDLGPHYRRVVLPEAHSSMLISPRVARYACAYLRSGEFPDSIATL
jgi:pimeloyl-ACP methyl ester carboxylesterase